MILLLNPAVWRYCSQAHSSRSDASPVLDDVEGVLDVAAQLSLVCKAGAAARRARAPESANSRGAIRLGRYAFGFWLETPPLAVLVVGTWFAMSLQPKSSTAA